MLLSAKRRIAPIAVLLLICSAAAMGGPITVMPAVTQNGSMFHYDYTVANMTGLDLAVLDIAVPGGPTVFSLVAPTGFQTAFDSGLGLVSFLEDTAVFGATPISGFAFDSSLGPGSTSFTATLLDAQFNVSTMTGSTTGPAGGAVPEPGSLSLLAGGALLLWMHRRRADRLTSRS